MKSKTKTLLTDAVLRDMLKQAGIDSAGVQFRLLGDGMFNAVFAAETNPPVVMKIAPRPQVPVMTYERNMLATELYWYDQIRQHTDIRVPKILYSDPAGSLWGDPVLDFLPLESFTAPLDKKTLSLATHNALCQVSVQVNRETRLRYAFAQGLLALIQEVEKYYRFTPLSQGWMVDIGGASVAYKAAFAVLRRG